MSKKQEVSIKVDDVDVIGEITYRSEADITIRIREPFQGLTHGCHIPYFSRPLNSFMTDYGERMAVNLLQYIYELGLYIKENSSTILLHFAAHFPEGEYSHEGARNRFFVSTFPFMIPLDLREEVIELIASIGALRQTNEHSSEYIPIRILKPIYTHDDRDSQRKVVNDVLVQLNTELGKYFDIWKQVGGGTTGYAIDAVQRLVKDADKLFRTKC